MSLIQCHVPFDLYLKCSNYEWAGSPQPQISYSSDIGVGSYHAFYFPGKIWLVELVEENQGGFSQRHVGDRENVDCNEHSSDCVREVNSERCDEYAAERYE